MAFSQNQKFFSITTTIFSHSRSEQFWQQNTIHFEFLFYIPYLNLSFVTGIDRVIIRSIEGIRIASTTSIQTLMKSDFDLVINDFAYRVQPPPFEVGAGLNTPLDDNEVRRLGDVRALVGELYEVYTTVLMLKIKT